MGMRLTARRIALAGLALCGACVLTLAAPTPGLAQADADAQANDALARQLQGLRDVIRTREQLLVQRGKLQSELGSERARGREEEVRAGIRRISDAIAQLDRAFSMISSEVDPRGFIDQEHGEEVDLGTEVKDLIAPLVSELKRATRRPREIDRLRTEIAETGDRADAMQLAVANLDTLVAAAQDPTVREALQSEHADWSAKLQAERTRLTVAQQQLAQEMGERKTLAQSLDDLFELFFRSRGRNLLIALAVTGAFWLLLRRTHEQLRRRGPLRRDSKRLGARIFDLAYMVFTVVGALLVFVIVLYFFGDWVLLIAVVLVLLGLAWASKQAIPRFWSQATLLLDMGPVRDGERLVYEGLPYRIESLGLYTHLDNPLLSGGPIRLPIDDLGGLRSRPVDEAEPWFPTELGDWVVMPDGTYGRVDLQSIETVRLRRAGGAERFYRSSDFLAASPEVISRGFMIRVQFGIDYRHQAIATREVPDQLRAFIERGIAAAGWDEPSVALSVEFHQAAASSLDVVVLWELSGEAASQRYPLERLVNRLCVDACNEHGWEIPFQQVTVHRASET
jgi:small-conductance mechanosensitive channel